jgi:uncharacterized RDD family membrane protein YckC
VTEVVTGEAVVLEVPCARFPSRVLALAIDLAIQLIVIAVLLTIVALGAADHSMNTAEVTAIVVTVVVLGLIGYPIVWEAATRGRSPGKLALGLRVVGDDGSPERFRQALVRGLATLVDFWLVPFIGVPALVCSLLSAKGKRLGDVFAGTFVIQHRLPARRGAAAPPPVPPELAAWASGLELSGLTDQTAAMARLYLGRLPDLTPAARAELGGRISAAVRAQVSPPPPPGTPVPPYLAAVLAERYRRERARLMAPAAPGAGQDAAPPGAGPNGAPPGAGLSAAPPAAATPRWAPPGATTTPWAPPGAPAPRPGPASRWAAPDPARSPAAEWMETAGEGEGAQPVQHHRPHDHGQADRPSRPVQPDEPNSPAAAGTGFVPPQ